LTLCARNGCGSTRTSATVIGGHSSTCVTPSSGSVQGSSSGRRPHCHSLERPRRGWQLRKPKNDSDGIPRSTRERWVDDRLSPWAPKCVNGGGDPGIEPRRLGNNVGNINGVISRGSVAHYGASSEGGAGFSGASPALIMPGSRVRVTPLLHATQPLGRSRSSGFSYLALRLALSRYHY
jgi:hypothetical protein